MIVVLSGWLAGPQHHVRYIDCLPHVTTERQLQFQGVCATLKSRCTLLLTLRTESSVQISQL
jgi:hypothetical protein